MLIHIEQALEKYLYLRNKLKEHGAIVTTQKITLFLLNTWNSFGINGKRGAIKVRKIWYHY